MANKNDPGIDISVRAPNLTEMWHSTIAWFQLHYIQILIAIGEDDPEPPAAEYLS